MCDKPKSIPTNSHKRGTKALGLRYEAAVARAIPGALHGQWFEYWDRNGRGYCSPDIILPHEETPFVLECKLTDVELARGQLSELYIPVLSMAFGLPVRGIVVTRSLSRELHLANVVDTLSAAVKLALTTDCLPTLHWLGRGGFL